MRLVHSGPGDPADIDAEARELLHTARAEADHLRPSLAEAEGFLDAVEHELRPMSMGPALSYGMDGRVHTRCSRDRQGEDVDPAGAVWPVAAR
jgi:hypothetical protein